MVSTLTPPARVARNRRRIVIVVAALLAVAALVGLFWVGLPSSVGSRAWFYSLDRLGRYGVGILLVSVAVGVSTVLFHTITQNRILTPSLMGFDAMYMLIQTAIVYFFFTGGAIAAGGLAGGGLSGFLVQTAIMVVVSTSLYLWLLSGRRNDIHLLLLVGIVIGVLFRSIGSLFQRLLDPAAYLLVQDALFASFRSVQWDVLAACALIVVACVALVAWQGPRLDVMLLGRDRAITLGVDHRRMMIGILIVVSLLVSASTVLVGPVLFFGLIVANAAYALLGSSLHRYTLPVACLLGVIALAGGEIFIRTAGISATLSIVIEFVGGLLFLYLILSNRTR